MIRNSNEFTFSFSSISRFRRVLGVVLGLSYALLFYAFQFVLRELLRVGSTSELNEMWLLSDEEVAFYNWFAAALALLIGQSVCIGFWFSRSKRLGERGVRSRTAIMIDQQAVMGNFLLFFLKAGFLYALFMGLAFPNFHLAFSFYPDYAFMFVLIVLVLFLQAWYTIRLKFKRQSFKLMLFAFFGLGLASWGLSKINVVDYKQANERILEQNIWYTHDLQVPKVNFEQEEDNYLDDAKSFIFYRPNDDTNKIGVYHDGKSKTINDTDTYGDDLFGWQLPQFNYVFDNIKLYIDKRIKMRSVNAILNEFRAHDIDQICYALLPTNAVFPAKYHDYVLIDSLTYECKDVLEFEERRRMLDTVPNKIIIEHNQSGVCTVNGQWVGFGNLEDELYKRIMSKTDYMVEYRYSDELCFDDYIQFKCLLKNAILRVKDFFAWYEYAQSYTDLERYLKHEFDEKHPTRILQIMHAN